MSDLTQHGTIGGYKYHGCRCALCRAATGRYEKRRKWLIHQGLAPTVPAHGFNRRVHALMCIGWTQKEIAAHLGIAQGNLAVKLRSNTFVRRATHEAMCEVYERLSMTTKHSVVAARTARIAAKRGWPPPLAWNDIDDPAETPTGWHYISSDRATAVLELDSFGLGVSEVCRRLDMTRDHLQKWCGRRGMSDVYRRLAAREDGMANEQLNGGMAS